MKSAVVIAIICCSISCKDEKAGLSTSAFGPAEAQRPDEKVVSSTTPSSIDEHHSQELAQVLNAIDFLPSWELAYQKQNLSTYIDIAQYIHRLDKKRVAEALAIINHNSRCSWQDPSHEVMLRIERPYKAFVLLRVMFELPQEERTAVYTSPADAKSWPIELIDGKLQILGGAEGMRRICDPSEEYEYFLEHYRPRQEASCTKTQSEGTGHEND